MMAACSRWQTLVLNYSFYLLRLLRLVPKCGFVMAGMIGNEEVCLCVGFRHLELMPC